MFKGSTNFRKKEPGRYPFQINKWMDTFNSPIWNKRLVDCKNIDITDFWYKRRPGVTKLWTSWSGTINGLWVIKKESWDILVRASGTSLQKYSWSTWSTITTISNIPTEIVSFVWPNNTSTALKTWTATWGTSRSLETAWMTENEYVSKYILITSWTGAGQEKLITSNTATTVFVEWLWQTTPDATSVFNIRDRIGHVYITNGTDNFMRYDGTTLTSYPNTTKFHHLETVNNRLFWAREDEDILYFSDLWVWNFPEDNFVLVDQDWDKITSLKANQDRLIIYKQNSRHRLIGASPDFFQLVQSDSHKWAISSNSVCNWNNLQFFLSYEWIEMYNTLENSTLEEWLPISNIIRPNIRSHSSSEQNKAKWMVYKNKMLMAIWSECYVYDIEQTEKKETRVWTKYTYPYDIQLVKELQGVWYVCMNGDVYKIDESSNTDDWTNISTKARIWRTIQKDSKRKKNYLRGLFEFEKTSSACNVWVYVSYEWWAQTLIDTVDISTTPEISLVLNNIKKDVDVEFRYTTQEAPEFIWWEISFYYLSKL